MDHLHQSNRIGKAVSADKIVRTVIPLIALAIAAVLHVSVRQSQQIKNRAQWVNPVSNAIKYSGNKEQPQIEIGSFSKEGQFVFFVKDNGVGFDEKYKDKLFRVFQRLHTVDEFQGTGVGLALLEKIISKHGGKVCAEAALHKVAAFYFSLPSTFEKTDQL